MQGLWRSGLLPPTLRQALRPAANQVILTLAGRSPASIDALSPGPITISGFFGEVLGIGRAAHLTADALEAAGYKVVRHDIRAALHGGSFRTGKLPGAEGGVWLLHCNPPEAAVVMSRIAPTHWKHKYRIGYWAYELPKVPNDWLRFSRNFHEVWGPSTFVTDALAGAACPVRLASHPLPPISPALRTVSQNRIQVLALADLRSSAARKNPLGAVRTFLSAFPEAQDNVALTVKIVRPDADSEGFANLQRAVARRPDINLIASELSAAEIMELFHQSDIFLSLHRSEGFGLAILEAMLAGCAVLATGWSGNLEFMNGMEDALIPYSLQEVADPSRIYPSGSHWAEPDLEVAAARLRQLARSPALRAAQAEAARGNFDKLRTRWSPETLAREPFDRWATRA
jgi:hypothetical protein